MLAERRGLSPYQPPLYVLSRTEDPASRLEAERLHVIREIAATYGIKTAFYPGSKEDDIREAIPGVVTFDRMPNNNPNHIVGDYSNLVSSSYDALFYQDPDNLVYTDSRGWVGTPSCYGVNTTARFFDTVKIGGYVLFVPANCSFSLSLESMQAMEGLELRESRNLGGRPKMYIYEKMNQMGEEAVRVALQKGGQYGIQKWHPSTAALQRELGM